MRRRKDHLPPSRRVHPRRVTRARTRRAPVLRNGSRVDAGRGDLAPPDHSLAMRAHDPFHAFDKAEVCVVRKLLHLVAAHVKECTGGQR